MTEEKYWTQGHTVPMHFRSSMNVEQMSTITHIEKNTLCVKCMVYTQLCGCCCVGGEIRYKQEEINKSIKTGTTAIKALNPWDFSYTAL